MMCCLNNRVEPVNVMILACTHHSIVSLESNNPCFPTQGYVIRKKFYSRKLYHDENNILKKIKGHQNIASPMFSHWWKKSIYFPYYGIDLFQYISEAKSPFAEKQVISFLSPLLLAIQHCHQHGIVHADIKLENILLDDEQCVRLIDFSSAIRISMWKDRPRMPFHGIRGTPTYLPREIHSRQQISADMLRSIDYYALGICAHLLLTKEYPVIPYVYNKKFSADINEFLSTALSTNHEIRNTLENYQMELDEIVPSE